MSDNLRQYRAIRDALTPGDPGEPPGRMARPWTPLAALLSGMGASQSPPVPHGAAHVPKGPKPESRVQHCARWLDHARSVEARYVVPSAAIGLAHGACEPRVVVLEGRGVGRGGTARMLHVIAQGRARPLAWRVRQGPQGPVPADLPSALVERIRACLPAGTHGVWRGDGACEGSTLQKTRNEAGGVSACRTAQPPVATWPGAPWRRDTLGACRKPGPRSACKEGKRTRDAYGPGMVLRCWAKGSQAPRSVVRKREAAEEACRSSQKRFRSETLFSDQTSRGCHLHPSQIAAPQRLSRFLSAAC
jgi:hypothetical protein